MAPPNNARSPARGEEIRTTQPNDLISSLPGPIVRLLVILGKPIAGLRVVLEVLLWKPGRRVESWMVVGGWWGVCIGGSHAFRYLLPLLVFAPLLPLNSLRIGVSATPKAPSPELNTHETLVHTLADIHNIHILLPPSPLPTLESIYARFELLGPYRLARGCILSWITWIVIGRIISYRALLALLGTIILLLPSPSFAHGIKIISASSAVQRMLALMFLLIFGSPPEQSFRFSPMTDWSLKSWITTKWATSRRPSLAFAWKPKISLQPGTTIPEEAIIDEDNEESKTPKPGQPLYFRFEIHENQRWWMGLDWTSALLPQERPSWCDGHLLPVSPPPSFGLPTASSIELPAPTKVDPGAKVRRTATWRWVDDDWSIVRAGPAAAMTSTTTTLPSNTNTTASPTIPSTSGFSTAHEDDSSNLLGTSPSKGISSQLGTSPPTSSEPAFAKAQTYAEQAFTKGLERLKARTTSPVLGSKPTIGVPGSTSSPRSSMEFVRGRSESQTSDDSYLTSEEHASLGMSMAPMVPIVAKDDATDMDGWVYGDNKWEGMGPKGGLGRFTRRRRWQRRAVCEETIQKIPGSSSTSSLSSPAVIQPSKAPPIVSATTTTTDTDILLDNLGLGDDPSLTPRGRSIDRDRRLSNSTSQNQGPISMIPPVSEAGSSGDIGGTARDDLLRQRLKKAMGSMGG